jgi:hypothetical protein
VLGDIAFNAASQGEADMPGKATVSHTCSGSNRILLSIVGDFSGQDSITGVSYANVPMNKFVPATGFNTMAAPTNYAYLYYLTNPPLGTHDIVVSAGGSSSAISVASVSYSGVSQTSFPDNWVQPPYVHDPNEAPQKQKLACASDKCWFVLGGMSQRKYSAGNGATLRTAPHEQYAWFDSGGAYAAGDTHEMTVILETGVGAGVEFMMSLAPAPL